MQFYNTLEFAQQQDQQDVLRHLREQFIIPERDGKQQIYFLGNSLGLQPKNTAAYISEVLQQWAHWGVEGFFEGTQPWLQLHGQLVNPLAAIVGALPHEVTVMNQLTVNLHLMMVSFYQPQGKRNKILCEAKAFPSDQYMLETHIRQRGLDPDEVLVEIQPRKGSVVIEEADFLAAIEKHKDELALVLWGGVNYYTGQVFNMQAITKAAQQYGAKVGFDLAHAAGNIELQLHDWNVDFACWCSYKYLNSGPGAVGGVFVHQRYHNDNSLNRFAGWWGYNREKQFLMLPHFDPIRTAEGWQLSTPSPILFVSHQASLELFAQAGAENVFRKGQQLSDYLLFIIKEINNSLPEPIIQVLTPEKEKGCQVSILIPVHGKTVFKVLSDNGIFSDWREPDVIRVAPVPLYNTFKEVWQFGQVLQKACQQLTQKA